MRPFETLMVTANLLALASITSSRPHVRRWSRFAVPIALLLTAVQAVVEGLRWQMSPAYALTVALFLISLTARTRPGAGHSDGPGVRIGAGLGVTAALASTFLAMVMPVFGFPKPTGPYSVGTMTYHWVDTGRPELFTTDPGDHRELMAQVWYPAEARPSASRAPYIEDADAVTPALARAFGLPAPVFSQLGLVTTHAVASAPIAADHRYPVLVSLSGLNGFRAASTFQIEELASHGYIVVGLDQPGAAAMTQFPDGRKIPAPSRDQMYRLISQSWTPKPEAPTLQGRPLPNGIIPYFVQDVSFALDQLAGLHKADPNDILTGRLDLERAGVFGISWGGATAAEACANDQRLKACFIMDAQLTAKVVKSGLQQPAMFMTRDPDTFRLERDRSGGWPDREISRTIGTMTDVYQRSPTDGYYAEVPGLFHLDFTDAPIMSPLARPLGLNGTIDAHRAHDIINAYSVAFFDKHLVGTSTPLLNGPSASPPEVRFLHHVGRS